VTVVEVKHVAYVRFRLSLVEEDLVFVRDGLEVRGPTGSDVQRRRVM
jgi:hypothetical protein